MENALLLCGTNSKFNAGEKLILGGDMASFPDPETRVTLLYILSYFSRITSWQLQDIGYCWNMQRLLLVMKVRQESSFINDTQFFYYEVDKVMNNCYCELVYWFLQLCVRCA